MATYAITGGDTLTIYDRVLTDLADDDVSTITFPNDLVNMKTGKNRNALYAKNETGNNAQLVLRVLRGSADDRFLQGRVSLQERDFAAQQLAEGTFVKRIGDGTGQLARDVHVLKGGVITRKPDAKENTSGDTVQAVAIYTMMFAEASRSIQ